MNKQQFHVVKNKCMKIQTMSFQASHKSTHNRVPMLVEDMGYNLDFF